MEQTIGNKLCWIADMLNDIADEMCDKYCKYQEKAETDEEYEQMLDEVCSKCPITKI